MSLFSNRVCLAGWSRRLEGDSRLRLGLSEISRVTISSRDRRRVELWDAAGSLSARVHHCQILDSRCVSSFDAKKNRASQGLSLSRCFQESPMPIAMDRVVKKERRLFVGPNVVVRDASSTPCGFSSFFKSGVNSCGAGTLRRWFVAKRHSSQADVADDETTARDWCLAIEDARRAFFATTSTASRPAPHARPARLEHLNRSSARARWCASLDTYARGCARARDRD